MRRLLALTFLLYSGWAHSQSWMNWSDASVGYSPIERIKINVGAQYRWNVSENTYSKSLLNLRISGKMTSFLSLQARYRRAWMPNEYFYLDQKTQTYGHRFAIGLKLDLLKTLPKKWDWRKKIGLTYSSFWQVEQFKFKRNQTFWRNKLMLDHELPFKRIRPFYSIESFYRLNQYYTYENQSVSYFGLMNEMRYEIGLSFDLPKSHGLAFSCIYRDFQTQKWDVWVMQVSYQYTIGKKKKKSDSSPTSLPTKVEDAD